MSKPNPLSYEARADASSAIASPTATNPPRLSGMGRLLWALVWLLPKNGVSRVAGRFASIEWPSALQKSLLRFFARAAGVDLSEAAEPIEAYPSLQKFFTRALRDGVRPLEGDESTLVSPCDGAWGAAGPIDGGTLVQVKGRNYRVRDLLGHVDVADGYEGGFFATFYLSPRDYHRLHTPTSGSIRYLDYFPGALWPVNSIGVLGVDGLFAVNERICAYLDPDGIDPPADSQEVVGGPERAGQRRLLAMVAVGATMVGSVRLRFDALTTNQSGATAESRDLGAEARHFERGEEWGHFEFGSTIVLLVPPETFELRIQPPGTPLRLGEALGKRIA